MGFRSPVSRGSPRLCLGAAMALLSWTTGCGSSSNGAAEDAGGDAGSEAAADASRDSAGDSSTGLDSSVTDAARDAQADAPGDGAVVLPAISGLTITPNPNNILSATVTFTTNVPATAAVQVTNTGDGGASNSFAVGPTTGPSTSFSINILGMRAQSTFGITVTATDAASNVATGAATYTTGALPAVIPPITVVTSDPTKTSPGFTVMTIWKWDFSPVANIDYSASSLVALDPEGQVVWYYLPSNTYAMDPKKLPNGDLAFLTAEDGWAEIDMMGNVVRSSTSAAMGLDSMHHELFPEPSSPDYLTLSTELRQIPGYPAPDGGTTTYPVVGDVVAEFNGEDGGVLHQWRELDMLDPMREGDPSLFGAPFWNGLYRDAGATKDWSHANAVVTDPSDDAIVVSSRTQGWVYKFARTDGGTPAVLWRLGAGGDFTLTNAGETFQYGQHGANVLANGHVMLFDDGNDRPAADGGVNLYSRALEYALDTTAMTATIVWQYQESPPFYAQFLGSSYLLPNGNVLVCAGGLTDSPTASPSSPSNLKSARIMEVTHDAVPVKVMEYQVRQELNSIPSDPNFSGYSVYRATRIPSLY